MGTEAVNTAFPENDQKRVKGDSRSPRGMRDSICFLPFWAKIKVTVLMCDDHYYNPNGLVPTPIRVRSQVHGFSPGLKKCPPDTFLPCLRQGRPLRIPHLNKKKNHTVWCGFSFWQRMRDSNPRKRSQSPVCYRYTNPLSAERLYYIPKFRKVKRKFHKSWILLTKLKKHPPWGLA